MKMHHAICFLKYIVKSNYVGLISIVHQKYLSPNLCVLILNLEYEIYMVMKKTGYSYS